MAITFRDSKEIYLFRETLAAVLRPLVGKKTIIDLRNEASIYGKISYVNGYMDVELTECVFRNPRGEFFPFDIFYVRNRNIRFVHIPDGFTAPTLINQGLEMGHKPKIAKSANRKVAFKQKRAQLYQKEILDELAKQ